MTTNTNTTLATNDSYLNDLHVAVNTIADALKNEAAVTDDPAVQAAWVRAEVGREALKLGAGAHDRVLLADIMRGASRSPPHST